MNNFTISLVSACKVTTNYPTMQLFEIKSWPFLHKWVYFVQENRPLTNLFCL